MKSIFAKNLSISFFLALLLCWSAIVCPGSAEAFEPMKGDMSTFIPTSPKSDTDLEGDIIKVGLLSPFTGSAAVAGDWFYLSLAWVAHDINTQGGIFVDGKMKKIKIILGDTQVKPDIAKNAVERMYLEDKVDVVVGTPGTHITAIAQSVAGQYKKIFMNYCSFSDLLLDEKHWNPYVFQVAPNTTQWTLALANFYANRPEKKFYLLCQDYAYGHAFAECFKKALKDAKPTAEIVGEDFHPLFLKDFAPYLTKIMATGAEVIITQDWSADNQNLLRQSRQMGMTAPVASIYVDDPIPLQAIGGPAGAGMVVMQTHIPSVKTALNKKFNEMWHASWQKWQAPYKGSEYKWPQGFVGSSTVSLYWLFDVMQRAKTTEPDPIIKVWEGDNYVSVTGPMYMRPQDHLMLTDIYFSELVFPNKWYDENASWGEAIAVSKDLCTPPVINGRK